MAPGVAERAEDVTLSPFLMLNVADITSSSINPRKHFNQARLEELARTMAPPVGIIEPLVVRLVKGKYELVAGERRLKAAKIAGLTEAPAVVKTLTDAQVLEIMVIENNQREDINALEEADGFRRLTKFGFDIDKLAQRLGRSRKYIYDRIKLLDLIPEAKTLLLDERITPGHAILLARLSAAQQQQAVHVSHNIFGRNQSPLFQHEERLFTPEERDAERSAEKDPYRGMKACTVRELEAWIDQHCRFEAGAPVNVELFPATAAAVEEAKTVVFITHNHHVDPDAKDGNTQRIYSVVSWKRADGTQKSKTCDRSVTGVLVVGPGRGEAFEVCVSKDCQLHWKEEKKAKARAAKSPSAGSYEQRRQAELAKLQREREARAAREKAWGTAHPAILDAIATKVRSIPIATVTQELLAQADRADVRHALALLKVKTTVPEEALRVLLMADLIGDSEFYRSGDLTKRVKPLLGIDIAALLKKLQSSAQADSPAAAAKKRASKKK